MENEEYIDEKELRQYPSTISFESTEKILNQMRNSICRIKLNDGSFGTGFFCKIPFPTKSKLLPVLITNNHIINKLILEKPKEPIMIYTHDTQKYNVLYLDNRIYYTNENYDVTFIEIKENKDGINKFLELDDNIIENIFEDNNKESDHIYYIRETIYIIQYPEGKLSVSYGLIDKTSKNNKYNFSHLCSTKTGSSGSPILNITNNKVFGIHKQAGMKGNFNLGTFLDIPLKEFINCQKKISSQLLDKNENKEVKENKEIKENNEIKEIKEIKKSKAMSLKEFGDKYKIYIKDDKIQTLDLDGRQYGNEILEIVYKMQFKELTKLNFGYNHITDINILGKYQCKNLEILWLNNNKISDISVFQNVIFNNLKLLFLNDNNITDINILEKTNLENLEQLNLSNNKISNINVFEKVQFPKLKNLWFFRNKINDIKAFERFNYENLIGLDLRSNNINQQSFSSIINDFKKKIKWFLI